MKYLVTGGAGFIGSSVASKLSEMGNEVVIVDNMNEYYDVKLKNHRVEGFHERGIPIYPIDISNDVKLDKLFETEKFDRVCHLAAQAGVRYSLENPKAYLMSNIVGTFNILECAKKYNIKNTVIASSSSVYGERNSDGNAFKETDLTNRPESYYAETKIENELAAYNYHNRYNMNITCLRFFTVYGPKGRPDMAPWIFTENILDDKSIKVFNHGKMSRDYTYIDDIADGVIKALEKPLGYEIINLGNGSPVKLMDMIEIIEKATGKIADKIYMDKQPGDVERTFADNSKAKKLLSWEPHTTLSEGLTNFVNWYKEYQVWRERHLESKKYNNIK